MAGEWGGKCGQGTTYRKMAERLVLLAQDPESNSTESLSNVGPAIYASCGGNYFGGCFHRNPLLRKWFRQKTVMHSYAYYARACVKDPKRITLSRAKRA
jgi:hypothetical protein